MDLYGHLIYPPSSAAAAALPAAIAAVGRRRKGDVKEMIRNSNFLYIFVMHLYS